MMSRGIAVVVLMYLLAGCGGGGGGGSGGGGASNANSQNSAAATMTLVSSDLNDGATNVARDISLHIVFSSKLNPDAATASNVSLASAAGNADVELSVLGAQLIVTPLKKLLPSTAYALTVTSGLIGADGERLKSSQRIRFTTSADEAWDPHPSVIDGGTGGFPEIAFDSNGNAMAVWIEFDGTADRIYASRYTMAGWSAARRIDHGVGRSLHPKVAFDASGNAIAVWSQYDGTAYNIYANRYTTAAGWGTAQTIETGSGDGDNPQLVFDANGTATVVWSQYDGLFYSIYANRYVSGGGWQGEQLIETGDLDAYDPMLAVNAGGDVFAVWSQYDGTIHNIYANLYTAGIGWGTKQLIETGSGEAYYPKIVFDAAGNATAAWEQYDGSDFSIYANRYISGSGWGTEQLIETSSGGADSSRIAVDGAGDVMAVWRQYDGVTTSIYANRYTPAGGWGTARQIESGGGQTYIPQIALDGSGNAIAVWLQRDSIVNGVFFNRFTPSGGWEGVESITGSDGTADGPQVGIDGNGHVMAVWGQSDGTDFRVYASRYD